ncbi:hypothetical protein niasHT_023819 [Heterodera trifolii]|uniref:Uncharacterized protein n=1 Tax=Heterodera trifolii TaxID=157864 RepID=A0ABD2JRT3_9BILA
MLILNGRSSLFALFLLCFSYISSSVLVDGARDGAPKSGTESPSSSTSSRASLTDLFANDHHKTLAELIAEERGKESKKGTTLAELIRAEGIGEEEFDQLVEEIGDNERLIEEVFEDEAHQVND